MRELQTVAQQKSYFTVNETNTLCNITRFFMMGDLVTRVGSIPTCSTTTGYSRGRRRAGRGFDSRNVHGIYEWAVIELGFLAALQAVIGGFDSLTVHHIGE